MIDVCRHCTARGDLAKCQSIECAQHNRWMVRELLKEREIGDWSKQATQAGKDGAK